MKQLLLFVSLTFFLLSGCSHSGAEWQLAEALKLAGDNRAELEAVLSYYSNDPVKFEAAKYLIANMPGHYSYADTALVVAYSENVDSILESMKGCSMYECKDSINACAERMGVARWDRVQDIHVITSNYLIRNIDNAFKMWHGPWAQHLSFDEFCELLLPYKVRELQLLDDWRTRLKHFHSEDLSDMKKCDAYRNATLEAARRLSRSLGTNVHPNYNSVVDYPIMRFEVNAKIPCGSCDYYAPIAMAIHRANGIPVGHDFTPHWATRRLGHSWNVVLAENGRTTAFNGISQEPDMARNGISVSDGDLHNTMEKIAKVYRHTYARNSDVVSLNEHEVYVPSFLRNVFISDVTDQYMETSDVKIRIKKAPEGTSYAYLAVYGDNDWFPIAFSKVHGNKVTFQNMGRNILYIAMCYDADGKRHFISSPFILQFDGTIHYISLNKETESVTLVRKYPVLEYVYKWLNRIDSCEIQASNEPSFSHYYVIHRTDDSHGIGHSVCVPDTFPPCRYWRLYPLKDGTHGNIAEVFFYDDSGTEIHGKAIGTLNSVDNRLNRTKEAVFDGDLLTYFDSPDNGKPWAGLDLGHPAEVKNIIYYGRGDGNAIEPNNTYELFYWYSNNWRKIGRKRSNGPQITFDCVPQGALLLLRNITKGHDERPFTYNNGQQMWW